DAEAAVEHADRARAFSKAGVRFPARYRRPANLTGPSRSQRSMLRLVQEPRGIGSNHSAAAAWGHSIVRLVRRWCDYLAARPIASKADNPSIYAASETGRLCTAGCHLRLR